MVTATLQKKAVPILTMLFGLAVIGVTTLFTLEVMGLNAYLHEDCTLPENICPFNQSVPSNSIFGYTAGALMFVFGLALFIRKEPAAQPKLIKISAHAARAPKVNMAALEPDEKKVVSLISAEGAMFQSALVEKTGFSKVKVTRLLDRLESKGIVERKRRGMTNVVMLRYKA